MGLDVGPPGELRPTCTWPGCQAGPDVHLTYGPLTSGPVSRLPPGLTLTAGGGSVDLCDAHAAEFSQAVEAPRVVALERLR